MTQETELFDDTIENNIRKKVVERMVINPAYYAKMSEILEQLILDRRRGVIAYGQLLDTYMELAKNVAKPEENTKYRQSENASVSGYCRAGLSSLSIRAETTQSDRLCRHDK